MKLSGSWSEATYDQGPSSFALVNQRPESKT